MSETATNTATALLEAARGLEHAHESARRTATGLESSSPRTFGSEPPTAAVAETTAAVEGATAVGSHGGPYDGPTTDEEWSTRQALAREHFLAQVQKDVASLYRHLQIDRAKRAHPAGAHRQPDHPAADRPQAASATRNPQHDTVTIPVLRVVEVENPPLRSPARSTIPCDKVVHVYESLWSNNPRPRSNRKIERHIARWRRQGYELARVDDNRAGNTGVLRATLTFHRATSRRWPRGTP